MRGSVFALACIVACAGSGCGKSENFTGTVAVKNPGFETELKYHSADTDPDTPFLSDPSANSLREF
ncbi:MAG: hypothetical protein LBO73_01160 [Holosporaceae bacterium]|nr:hypothetical protein [Holosporaceae bacterium]